MYIGVAIDITTKQLHQQLLSNKTYKLVNQKISTLDSEAMLLQLDSSRFCFHYIKRFRKGDKYLFSVISKDKDFLEELFISNIIDNSFVDD
jgi:hypothetical protein